jgi:hypothetical protein
VVRISELAGWRRAQPCDWSFYIFEVLVILMRVGTRPVVWSAVACSASSRTLKDSLPAVPKVRFESPEISECGDSSPLLHATTRRGELPPLTSQRLQKAAASCRTPNSVPSTSAPAH